MTAIVHFVAFATDGVIESAASGMPGATDFVEKGGERKPIVKSASGMQRFACGPGQSKWWAKTDDKGILHVASGEPERVTCAECKQSKEYLGATGQLPVATQPTLSPTSQSHASIPASSSTPSAGSAGHHEGAVNSGGETQSTPAAGSDDTIPETPGTS